MWITIKYIINCWYFTQIDSIINSFFLVHLNINAILPNIIVLDFLFFHEIWIAYAAELLETCAQNAGNAVSGVPNLKFFRGECPPDPPRFVSSIYLQQSDFNLDPPLITMHLPYCISKIITSNWLIIIIINNNQANQDTTVITIILNEVFGFYTLPIFALPTSFNIHHSAARLL